MCPFANVHGATNLTLDNGTPVAFTEPAILRILCWRGYKISESSSEGSRLDNKNVDIEGFELMGKGFVDGFDRKFARRVRSAAGF